jgi:hypothetical protein
MMSQGFFETDEEYRKRLAREATERVVEDVTGDAPEQGFFEDDKEYINRISREANEGVIQDSTGSAPSQGFFESDGDYRERIVREAAERVIEDSTGNAPSQGFFESEDEYRRRIMQESTEKTIENSTGKAPSQGFFEDDAEYRKRISREAKEAIVSRERARPRIRSSDAETTSGSGDSSDLIELVMRLFVAVFIIWLVFMAVTIAIMLSPIWLGAVTVGVLTAFFLARRMSDGLPDDEISRIPITTVHKRKKTRLRVESGFLQQRIQSNPPLLPLIFATTGYGILLSAWPFFSTDEDFTRVLLGIGIVGGSILGTMAGKRLIYPQLENLILCRMKSSDAVPLLSPKFAMGASVPGFIALVGVWAIVLFQSEGILEFGKNLGFINDPKAVSPTPMVVDNEDPQEVLWPENPTTPGRSSGFSGIKVPHAFNPPQIATTPVPQLRSSSDGPSDLPTSQGVQQFIRSRLDDELSRDFERIVPNYADQVRYWGNGIVDRNFIRRDKSSYFERWPLTHEELLGQVNVSRNGDNWLAVSQTRFRVENPVKGIVFEGIQESTFTLQWVGYSFRIVAEEGRIIEKKRTELGRDPVNGGQQQANFPGERYPATRTRLLALEELNRFSESELRYAINEMFARHGADFAKREIKQQFANFVWYRPRPEMSFDEIELQLFSDLERANLKVLGEARSRLRLRESGAGRR